MTEKQREGSSSVGGQQAGTATVTKRERIERISRDLENLDENKLMNVENFISQERTR